MVLIRIAFSGVITVLLCWVTNDFELYAAFDPLADKVRFIINFIGKIVLAIRFL